MTKRKKRVSGLDFTLGSESSQESAPESTRKATVHYLPGAAKTKARDNINCSQGFVDDKCSDYKPLSWQAIVNIGYKKDGRYHNLDVTLDGRYRSSDVINFIEQQTGQRPFTAPRQYSDLKRGIGKVSPGYHMGNNDVHIQIRNVNLEKKKITPKIRF